MAKFKVVDGPGKFDLMLALFESKQVKFKIQHPAGSVFVAVVRINQIAAEDGSKHSWNLEGGVLDLAGTVPQHGWHNFKAYFHSRTRQGTLEF